MKDSNGPTLEASKETLATTEEIVEQIFVEYHKR